MNSYELSRAFWDYAFENPHKIKPPHAAIYFFSIEHCNRLGWKTNFGFPTTMVMEATGIKSYNTYLNHLTDLVEWGFIIMVEKSKNQYSSNIIALSNFDKAHDKALDKALLKHTTKQSESTVQSIVSINKPINNETTKPINKENKYPSLEEFLTFGKEKKPLVCVNALTLKFHAWSENDWHKESNGKRVKINNWKTTLLNTLPYIQEGEPEKPKFQRVY